MGLVVREIVGWLLVLAGLGLVAVVLDLALSRKILEAFALTLPSVVVFRSGMSLVKIATAARVLRGGRSG